MRRAGAGVRLAFEAGELVEDWGSDTDETGEHVAVSGRFPGALDVLLGYAVERGWKPVCSLEDAEGRWSLLCATDN